MLNEGKGPANAPLPNVDYRGISDEVVSESIKLAFDCEESLQRIRELKDEMAVVIIEPMPSGYPRSRHDKSRGDIRGRSRLVRLSHHLSF